jgi:hypothetical protein
MYAGMYCAEFLECTFLVGKIMMGQCNFSDYEIRCQNLLAAQVEWNKKISDFLCVIAGSAHPNIDLYDECYAALISPQKQQGGDRAENNEFE